MHQTRFGSVSIFCSTSFGATETLNITTASPSEAVLARL